MRKGKIIKKDNCLHLKTIVEGVHSDEVEVIYYPVSITESNIDNLVENKVVNFKIEKVDYSGIDGLSGCVEWAIV